MADDFEVEHPDEQEGGPVKSFLEHLEDLRWVLIKSAATLALAMLICLISGNYVVRIIKWPLSRARLHFPGNEQIVTVRFLTNNVGIFHLNAEEQQSLALGTNRFVAVRVEPAVIGTNQVLTWRADPDPTVAETAQQVHVDLVNLSPAGGFVVAFQVAIYGGMVLAAPFILFYVAQFVFPALRMREKKYVYGGLAWGGGLFFAGVSFCYFVLMPVALSASQLYSQWLGFGAYQWKAEDYISFVCKFMLGMGLGFQLPVVLLTLVRIGVLSYGLLRKMWRYMIVITLILGAVLTTPEVITQVLMAGPLYLLYEVSVWMAWYMEHPDRTKARRRLIFAVLVAVLIGAGLWLGWKFGWPWLMQRVQR